MAVFRRKSSQFYFIGFEYKGKRYRISSRTTSRRQAEQLEVQLRQQVYDEVTLGRLVHQPMRFEDAVKRYVTTHLKTKERLDKTISAQSYLLARLVRLIGADTILDDITTEVVANVKEQVFEAGKKKPATANQYLATLRAILRMAHLEWNRMARLPRFRLYSLKNERSRWLRPEEEIRLLRACEAQPHLKDLVTFLLDTGARLSEACRLTWDQVVLPKRSRGSVCIYATKTKTSRTVPLTLRTDELLRRLHEIKPVDQERVFLIRTVGTAWRGTEPQAKPFTNPSGAWKSAVKTADIENIRLHDLRHTFASKLVQRGVPLLTVTKLLGHSSLKMTMRYAHLNAENERDAISKLN